MTLPIHELLKKGGFTGVSGGKVFGLPPVLGPAPSPEPNPPKGPAPNECPYCYTKHEWDHATDSFKDAKLVCIPKAKHADDLMERDVDLMLCRKCGAVIAVTVTDNFGGQLYIPPSTQWNDTHGY